MAKRFFYASLGILALATAYHLGASRTDAQGTGPFVALASGDGMTLGEFLALTAAGDVWRIEGNSVNLNPEFLGNVLGGPVSVDPSSLGAIKGSYR